MAWRLALRSGIPTKPENPTKLVGLICATGGRSASLIQALRQAGYSGYADISEGMLGSGEGPGWIASNLPTVPVDVALNGLPPALA